MATVAIKPSLGGAPKVDWASFIGKTDEGYILVLGPSGEGKTFSGLSVSEKFDEARLTMNAAELTKLPLIELDDVLHLAFDLGALDGIMAFGMKPLTIPMRQIIEALGPNGEVEFYKILPQVLEAAYKPGLKYLLTDTVSSLDEIYNTYWHTHKPDEGTRGMWGEFAGSHGSYRETINRFCAKYGLQHIVLGHTRVQMREDFQATKTSKLKAEAEGRDTDMLTLAVTGKSGPAYQHHSSMTLYLDKVAPVGSQVKERMLLCGTACPMVLTKNRFVAVTGERMPGLLGKVLRQIKSHRAA